MPIPTEAEIADLKAKHAGTLHLLEYDDGESAVVAKQPPAAEWNRLVTVSTADPSARGRAIEDFARSCIVWPERAVLTAAVAERPALLARFGNELTEIAGAAEKIVRKKL